MTYAFDTQLAMGQQHEQRLDAFFARWYTIEPATRAEQRLGIDRIFMRHDTNEAQTVEYKADSTAGRTGNAFVETLSVDTMGKPGWAIASKAVILVYLVVEPETIYIIRMARLRKELSRWQSQYSQRQIPNQGYHTHGILVPLDEFERIAEKVF